MSDWKSNPAVAAAIAAGVVLSGTLTVCYTYVIPTYLKESQNETLETKNKLKESNEKNTTLEKKIDDYNKNFAEKVLKETYGLSVKILELTSSLEIAKSETSAANAKYAEAIKEKEKIQERFFKYTLINSFMSDSPLPIGYNKIRIGSSLSDFYKTYAKPEIDNDSDEGYLSVKPSTGVIGEISYKFNKKNLTVESISLTKREDLNLEEDEFNILNDLDISSILTDVIGKPLTCDEKPKFKYWRLNDNSGYIFNMGNNFHYLILANGLTPAIWPRSCPPNHIKTVGEDFFPHIFPNELPQ
ncbi:hypothetical protein [Pantoea ananatis]|uniref:hypothetical protein n=1 Tax=Pantoea ananas TaxID=553 RepID=UPI000E2352CF|nr:hypothetical protein [Pantoea ananatis]REC88834.1 hypothetical protein C7423_12014 [Pantoea ananatis]